MNKLRWVVYVEKFCFNCQYGKTFTSISLLEGTKRVIKSDCTRIPLGIFVQDEKLFKSCAKEGWFIEK